MAIAIETSGSATTGNASSLTTSFTVITSAANYLVGIAGWCHNASSRTCSSMTYAGTGMTSLAATVTTSSVYTGVNLFGLASPASGANNLVTTMSASTGDIVHGFVSLTGADSTQSGTGATANGFPSGGGGQPAATVTGVANGIIIGACTDNCAAASLSTAETEQFETNSNVNQNTTLNVCYNTSSGSTQMDWTGPNFFNFSCAAFPFAATAATASSGLLIAM